jgi:hypothetical protein
MSQHTFISNGNYHVVTGWDYPSQKFFLEIEARDDYNECMVLNDHDMTLDQIAKTFHQFKIIPPYGLFTNLSGDQYYDNDKWTKNYGKYGVDYLG